jgi:hypothetical protein
VVATEEASRPSRPPPPPPAPRLTAKEIELQQLYHEWAYLKKYNPLKDKYAEPKKKDEAYFEEKGRILNRTMRLQQELEEAGMPRRLLEAFQQTQEELKRVKSVLGNWLNKVVPKTSPKRSELTGDILDLGILTASPEEQARMAQNRASWER